MAPLIVEQGTTYFTKLFYTKCVHPILKNIPIFKYIPATVKVPWVKRKVIYLKLFYNIPFRWAKPQTHPLTETLMKMELENGTTIFLTSYITLFLKVYI